MDNEPVSVNEVSSPTIAPGWKMATLALALGLLLLLLAYHETYSRILTVWLHNDTFAHGILIPFIVGFLVWRKRETVLAITPRPDWPALVLLFGVSLLWLLGSLADAAVVEQFAVMAMLPLMVWAVLGRRVAWVLLFPLAYLFFGVPFGEFLIPPLQDFTAAFTVKALRLSGLPVYWEGRFFYLPSGSFEVAKACSGVRYLIAALALGSLYAYLNYRSLGRRAAFIALCIVVPIVANGLRAYGIVMLAHLSDYTLAVGVDHILYGWVFFGLVMFLLFWLGSFFHEEDRVVAQDTTTTSASPASNTAYLASAVLAVAVAGSGNALVQRLEAPRAVEASALAVVLPVATSHWVGPAATDTDWQPRFTGAAVERQGGYRAQQNDDRVEVYLAYYQEQRQGRELVNVMNTLFDPEVDRAEPLGRRVISLPNGRRWEVSAIRILDQRDEHRLVWSWYEVAGRATTNPLLAKLFEVESRLRGDRRGSAVIAVSMKEDLDAARTEARLTDFLGEMLPALRRAVMVKEGRP